MTNFHVVPSQKRIGFQLAKERKASTTLGIIMSAFTVCWLPFFVLALVRPFLSEQSSIPASLSSLFLWLGYANSLLNPIIYATLNRDFRKPFQQILYFRCSTLNDMMREEFYHSQYGDPHYTAINNSNIVPVERPEDRQLSSNTVNNESFLWFFSRMTWHNAKATFETFYINFFPVPKPSFDRVPSSRLLSFRKCLLKAIIFT